MVVGQNSGLLLGIDPRPTMHHMGTVPPNHALSVADNKFNQQEGKEMFYLTMHSTHFIYGYKNYDVGHMVKDHSDSERGNLLLPHGLLFPINSKGSFICIIPQTG